MMTLDDLAVICTHEATKPQPDLFDAHFRTVVRFADQTAWITAATIGRCVSGLGSPGSATREATGVVVVCDEGPAETMAVVGKAADEGFSSPIRYPASNPGSLCGVSCIAFGLRGPTMNFAMPPSTGVPVALALAAGWLRRGLAQNMIVAVCAAPKTTGLIARAMLLSLNAPSAVEFNRGIGQ